MIKNIKNEILGKQSFFKINSILKNTIYKYRGWRVGENLNSTNTSYKTILFGLMISLLLLTMQCSKGGTDEVFPVAVKDCLTGQTKQADGTCKADDGTITCPVGQTLQKDGTCKTLDNTMKCPNDQTMQTDGTFLVTWTTLGATSNMKIARYAMKTAVVCTKIYAFGGSNGSSLITTEVYDTTTNVWTLLGASSNMNTARNNMGIAAMGTKIYAFGGIGSGNNFLNSTEVFDTSTNTWTNLGDRSNLNIPRFDMGVATIGTKIYAISGKDASYNFLNTTEVFDTTTNIWTSLGAISNINTARFNMGTTTIGSKIYVFGGQDVKFTNINTTEVLDTTTNIWTSLGPTSNLNTARSGLGAGKIGTKIYAFGGQDVNFSYINTTEVFDTTTNIWTSLGPTSNLNTTRYEMGAATLGTNIYVFGGHIETNYFNTMEVYRPNP